MEEGLRVTAEVPNLKDGLRAREVVLLEVVIETGPWAPEIRYASSCKIIGKNDLWFGELP